MNKHDGCIDVLSSHWLLVSLLMSLPACLLITFDRACLFLGPLENKTLTGFRWTMNITSLPAACQVVWAVETQCAVPKMFPATIDLALTTACPNSPNYCMVTAFKCQPWSVGGFAVPTMFPACRNHRFAHNKSSTIYTNIVFILLSWGSDFRS